MYQSSVLCLGVLPVAICLSAYCPSYDKYIDSKLMALKKFHAAISPYGDFLQLHHSVVNHLNLYLVYTTYFTIYLNKLFIL